MRREQKAKVGKRRHPLKRPDPNRPANCRRTLSGRRQRNKTGIRMDVEPRLPHCQTHRNKSCKLKKMTWNKPHSDQTSPHHHPPSHTHKHTLSPWPAFAFAAILLSDGGDAACRFWFLCRREGRQRSPRGDCGWTTEKIGGAERWGRTPGPVTLLFLESALIAPGMFALL